MDKEETQDILMDALAYSQAIMREIMEDWNAGTAKGAIKSFWQTMDPGTKEKFKQARPDDYANISSQLSKR